MSPFDQLFLPLLGGFFLIHGAKLSGYWASRQDGHRLIIWSAGAGIMLLTAAHWLKVAGVKYYPELVETLQIIVPPGFSDTAYFALLIGCLIWMPVNGCVRLFYSDDQLNMRTVREYGTQNEKLFTYADSNNKQVVAARNIELSRGKSIAIIGPSGTGKSTLVKAMVGLLAVSYTHLTLPTILRV